MKRFLGRLQHRRHQARRVRKAISSASGAARSSLDRGKDYGKMFVGDYPRSSWRRAVMQDYADVVQSGVPAYPSSMRSSTTSLINTPG